MNLEKLAEKINERWPGVNQNLVNEFESWLARFKAVRPNMQTCDLSQPVVVVRMFEAYEAGYNSALAAALAQAPGAMPAEPEALEDVSTKQEDL
jgi:hypothetical protein